MSRNGIVSAEEIMRRVKESPGGDVKDIDILAVKGKKPISYVPGRRAGHSLTRADLVGEYVRYITDIYDRRKIMQGLPDDLRQARILAEAEKAVARQLEGSPNA